MMDVLVNPTETNNYTAICRTNQCEAWDSTIQKQLSKTLKISTIEQCQKFLQESPSQQSWFDFIRCNPELSRQTNACNEMIDYFANDSFTDPDNVKETIKAKWCRILDKGLFKPYFNEIISSLTEAKQTLDSLNSSSTLNNNTRK